MTLLPLRHSGQGASRRRDPDPTAPHSPIPSVERSGDRSWLSFTSTLLATALLFTACGVKGPLKLPEEVERDKAKKTKQQPVTDDRDARMEKLLYEQRYSTPYDRR